MNHVHENRMTLAGHSAVCGSGNHQLRVETGVNPTPPSADHRLLMAFRFHGDESPAHDSDIDIPLRKLGNASGSERWWYRGEVEHRTAGPVKISRCADYAALSIDMPDQQSHDVRQATRDAYELLFSALELHRGFEFVRIWNFLSDINQGEEDHERYRQFSIGRAEAFATRGIEDRSAPVGTAIGSQSGAGMQIIALASSRTLDPVENPSQISAFNYPRQYGPRSPKFSRGGVVTVPCSRLFFVSGTAAVVGHQSAHPFRTGPQLGTTLENLDSLADAVASRYVIPAEKLLGESSHLRVYVRRVADYEEVREAISTTLAIPESQVIYLEGDICRHELMVEIEACTVFDHERQS